MILLSNILCWWCIYQYTTTAVDKILTGLSHKCSWTMSIFIYIKFSPVSCGFLWV